MQGCDHGPFEIEAEVVRSDDGVVLGGGENLLRCLHAARHHGVGEYQTIRDLLPLGPQLLQERVTARFKN